MNITEAVILGIIQGLTEFLPISSTAHLTVAGKLMNLISEQSPEKWTAFIAVIQMGTLLAVLVFFWRDLMIIFEAFIKDNLLDRKRLNEQSRDAKLGWYLVLASIPIVLIGLGFKHVIEGALTKNLYVISLSLIFFALLLGTAEKLGRFNRLAEDFKWYDALVIGFAQSFALIPGASRSGTTITAGLLLGFKRDIAARFSFLLSIPAIFLSGVLQFYQALGYIDTIGTNNLIVAIVISAIVGYLSIGFLLRFLQKRSTFIFIAYRMAIAVIILFLIALGLIHP